MRSVSVTRYRRVKQLERSGAGMYNLAHARSYPQLVDALRRKGLATAEVLAENWLRVLDTAKAQ